MRDMWRIQFILILFCIALQYNLADKPPNVVVILTDEHNFRTLGCYRDQMNHEQAFIWGKGVKVNTPNIDALAEEGALFTNFNVVAPLCTPSRASFMTGLYPWFTGAWKNHTPMNKDTVTWAEVLKEKAGYHTGYIGKWHLNGEAKPEFANFKRRFGFNDIKYMYNRGHWKFFEEGDEGLNVFDATTFKQFQGREEEHYATDFLFKKAQDFMRKQIKNEQHFALMLSIPDPHGPNDVREPYSTMFKRMKFKLPKTARTAYHKEPALPPWSAISTDIAIADQMIAAIEEDKKWQTRNQHYFGMVRLIDDKVGELMSFLKETGQDKNTIIVFTSDHGDMMGEHAKYNKGKPYMTSAGVPFIIRYPGHIRKGKIVKTAYSSPDFAPTLFSLVGIDHSDVLTQGIDGSDELFNRKLINERKQVRLMTDSGKSFWAAAVDRQYKLVVSRSSPPYLFDMKEDPDELVNYYEDPSYNNITSELKNALYEGIAKYNLPLATSPVFFFDTPLCFETQDQIPALPNKVCTDLKTKKHSDNCEIEEVNSFCTEACDICCDDSSGVISNYGKLISCDDVKNNTEYCIETQIARFCPLTCMECIPKPSSKPSDAPSFRVIGSNIPTITCLDDSTFYVNNPKSTCRWIGRSKTRIKNQCIKMSVINACPVTCGLCCKDDVNFKFKTSSGMKSCRWIGRSKTRIKNQCIKMSVINACPVTCGLCCKDDVNFKFETSSGMKSCKWLRANEFRVEEFCSKRSTDSSDRSLIKFGCSQTCNNCNELQRN